MIRVDAIWLATQPMDMRAGTETALARVVAVFGAAKPHCAYLFANRRANRMKVLVHDGVGIWLAARRLNQGKFHWPSLHRRCLSTKGRLCARGARVTSSKPNGCSSSAFGAIALLRCRGHQRKSIFACYSEQTVHNDSAGSQLIRRGPKIGFG